MTNIHIAWPVLPVVTLAIAVFVGLAAGCKRAPSAPVEPPQETTYTTDDGMEIYATIYPQLKPNPPGVILLHDEGRSRDDFRVLARQLQQTGIAVLAPDVRGHGESTTRDGDRISFRTFTTQDWEDVAYDIEAAQSALAEVGANPANIGLAGAGVSANLALAYAAENPAIQAVALISPGVERQGIGSKSPMKALSDRPTLLLAAAGDSYSMSSCLALESLASTFCETHTYPGAAYGVDLLAASPSAVAKTTQFFEEILFSPLPSENR